MAGQYRNELLAAEASDLASKRREPVGEMTRDKAQDIIAQRVAEAVVDPFKMVDVDHRQRQCPP